MLNKKSRVSPANPHCCREIKQILRKKEEDELQKFASTFFIY
ncbi:hypothetical protein CHCC20490_3734 [Bacillus paralicheniformis]|nr:hypothetical protein CHCC20490_3734 [Bacillus paralicheniformis]